MNLRIAPEVLFVSGTDLAPDDGLASPPLSENLPGLVDAVCLALSCVVALDGQVDTGAAEEVAERFGELMPEIAFVADVDPLEDGLVELSPLGVSGSEVGSVPVGGQRQRLVEVLFDGLGVGRQVDAPFGCLVQLGRDALLFGSEEVEWDGAGVVAVEQFLAFGFEASSALQLPSLFAFGDVSVLLHLFEEDRSELVDQFLGWL